MACPHGRAWRRYGTLDRKSRHSLAGGLSCRCERAGELRSDTSRTGTHRLLPRPKSVLSCAIGSCRRQSARAIRRRVVSGNYRNRPSETQATSATTRQQVARMSQRVARTRARDERNCARAEMTGSAICGDRHSPKPVRRSAHAAMRAVAPAVLRRAGQLQGDTRKSSVALSRRRGNRLTTRKRVERHAW
jgi:transcription initiation factor TFIIIB Brf1 subunit/transcription initiation factor TFIIB